MIGNHTLSEALTSGRGVERAFRCQVHEDSNASASVNVVKMVWVCYACGAHGKVDDEDAIPTTDDLAALLKEDPEPRRYVESWLDVFDSMGPSPYWESRYGYEVARAHRTGTHPLSGLPTYPVRDQLGIPVGVVVRQDSDPKYLYPSGIRVSTTLYGHLKPSSVVILVEGASDVMAIDQAGLAPGWTALGCYGAGLHLPQVSLVANLSPKLVIAAFDDDPAGWSATERSAAMLEDVAPVLSYRWGSLGDIKDPGQVDDPRQRADGLYELARSNKYGALAP